VEFILASSLTTKTSELLETCEVIRPVPNYLLNVKFYKYFGSAKNSENVTNLSTHLVQEEIVRIIITI